MHHIESCIILKIESIFKCNVISHIIPLLAELFDGKAKEHLRKEICVISHYFALWNGSPHTILVTHHNGTTNLKKNWLVLARVTSVQTNFYTIWYSNYPADWVGGSGGSFTVFFRHKSAHHKIFNKSCCCRSLKSKLSSYLIQVNKLSSYLIQVNKYKMLYLQISYTVRILKAVTLFVFSFLFTLGD